MTKAKLAMHIALISRISAQYTHEMAFGMWNPDFCSSDARFEAERFLTEMEDRLKNIRDAVGGSGKP